MKIVDVNVLLYAKFDFFPQHVAAFRWMEENLRHSEPIGFPWETICGFLRISTNPRALSLPLSTDEAWAQIKAWLGAPASVVVVPTTRHLQVLDRLLSIPEMNSRLVPDAQLAALALEHQAVFVTFDADFRKFTGLEVECPGE